MLCKLKRHTVCPCVNMAACGVAQMTVFLLGDSYLGRLRDWAGEQDKINLNLDPTQIKVEWEVKGVYCQPKGKHEFMAT